jgi:hypothetical protein
VRRMTRARENAGIQSVIVSQQAFSFLFITYKKIDLEKWKSKNEKNKTYEFILEESNFMSTIIVEAIEEWRQEKKSEGEAFFSSCDRELLFAWKDITAFPSASVGPFESDLIGRHDYFHLLESPWIPEVGNIVEKISQRLKEDPWVDTKELIGVPCIALDFRTPYGYFVGDRIPWFRRMGKPLILDSTMVHALTFIDLKRGLSINNKKLNLTEFLDVLTDLLPVSGTISQHFHQKIKKSIKGIFLGYGIYELVFLLEAPNLKELFTSVVGIRKCFMKTNNKERISLARGTSTMVFMPRKNVLEGKKKTAESDTEKIKYSILVSAKTGADLMVTHEIANRAEHMGINVDVLNRQGYYDLIVGFEESSFLRACTLIKAIRELSDVLNTSTIIKIDEQCIGEKLEGSG